MSLLSNAMPWTNDEQPQKKRVATMRKTIKATPYAKENTDSSPDAYMPSDSATVYTVPTVESIQKDNQERSERINELINQMSSVSENNDGAKLADFKPPPYAVNNKNGEEKPGFIQWQPTAEDEIEHHENELQQPVPKIQAHNDLVYGPSYTNTKFGNYHMSYDPTQMVYAAAAAAAKNNRVPTDDSRLMEKINYMIRLLENQAVEKTANITEEFILYTFLGVFMIFVLDSFVRVGKYVR